MFPDAFSFPAFLGFLESEILESQKLLARPDLSADQGMQAYEGNQRLIHAREVVHVYLALVESSRP